MALWSTAVKLAKRIDAAVVGVHALKLPQSVYSLPSGSHADYSALSAERFFVGSVTERVLRAATRPVLVVPEAGAHTLGWRPILCGVDFSACSIDAFEHAVRFATRYRAELALGLGSDLLVMGSRGELLERGLGAGSTVFGAIRASSIPILVVP